MAGAAVASAVPTRRGNGSAGALGATPGASTPNDAPGWIGRLLWRLLGMPRAMESPTPAGRPVPARGMA
jgi:hypothetical protein